MSLLWTFCFYLSCWTRKFLWKRCFYFVNNSLGIRFLAWSKNSKERNEVRARTRFFKLFRRLNWNLSLSTRSYGTNSVSFLLESSNLEITNERNEVGVFAKFQNTSLKCEEWLERMLCVAHGAKPFVINSHDKNSTFSKFSPTCLITPDTPDFSLLFLLEVANQSYIHSSQKLFRLLYSALL